MTKVEQVDLATAFEMGRRWQTSLRGQALEDSRGVGRLLQCYFFDPIEQEIEAELKRRGLNSFDTADNGITACLEIIDAALNAHHHTERARLIAALRAPDMVEKVAKVIMAELGCGLTIEGEHVFCDDPRAPDEIKQDGCECKSAGLRAITTIIEQVEEV